MKLPDYVILFVLIFILSVLIWTLISTIANDTATVGDPAETESGLEYGKFTIEGMPCVFYKEGSGNNQRGGLTCNWEMWNGR